MHWTLYDIFNAVEGALWWVVAATILRFALTNTAQPKQVPAARQQSALWLGAAAFAVFGITDWFEIGTAGQLPLWLWGLKVACGTSIFVARLTWRGWTTFRWNDREFLFGLCCLIAVALLIALQR